MTFFLKKMVFILLIWLLVFIPLEFDFGMIKKYINAYGGELYIENDVIWNNTTDLSDYGRIYIDNGATVTIEPGTTLQIPDVEVYYGKIVAKSTIENPITFSSIPVDTSVIENYDDYDPRCFESGSTLTFEVDLEIYSEPSEFEFVNFTNLGTYIKYDDSQCPGMIVKRNFNLLREAYAQEVESKDSAIHLISGKVEMNNVIFDNNKYADVKVDIELEDGDEFNADSYIRIKNSNFQNNKQNTAIVSDVKRYNYDTEEKCENNCNDTCDTQLCFLTCFKVCELEHNNFEEHDKTKVILENNWYGDETGPIHPVNLSYVKDGEMLVGDLTIDPFDWRGSVDFASSVLFLPGAKASKLYDNNNQIWPPTLLGDDYKNLLMDESGQSINDTYTSGIVDEVVGINIYKRFVSDLVKLKNDRVIKDYSLFAYDWREAVDDIVATGTEYENGVTKNPIMQIENLASASTSSKVTIVAHSNGGLLAKTIMQELERRGEADLVDNIIMVSSPQLGTPKAILTMLYGFNEKAVTNWMISDSEAREVVQNMPAAYGLLPTEEYFNRNQENLITFNSQNTRYRQYKEKYGDKIDSYEEFRDFLLAKEDDRQRPDVNDTEKENILNEYLFDKNTELQEVLSNWIPPQNVNLIQIGGWGLDTVKGVAYNEKPHEDCGYSVWGQWVCATADYYDAYYEPIYTIDGDEVVVTPSSLMLEGSISNVERLWVDLFEFNDVVIHSSREHKDILEIKQLRDLIQTIVVKHKISDELPKYILSTRPDDEDEINNSKHSATRIRMSLYSPLDIHLYDKDGNHTGPVADKNGRKEIENNIPNSYYDTIGEHKYVGWSLESDVKVELRGYDVGHYTLNLKEVSQTNVGEKINSQITFKNLPTNKNTKVALAVPATGLKEMSTLRADYDGDGEIDYEVTSRLNDVVTLGEDQTQDSTQGNSAKNEKGENDDEIKYESNETFLSPVRERIEGGLESVNITNSEEDISQNTVITDNVSTIPDLSSSSDNGIDKNNQNKTKRNTLIVMFITLSILLIISFIFKKLIK